MASPLDWGRIAEWRACIDRGELSPITRVFQQGGTDGPEARWNPAPDELAQEPLRFVLEFWRGLAGGEAPHMRHVDPLLLRPALGYLMLLDAVDGGRDFRYRLYGSVIARISDLDMTGRLLSSHPASAYATEFAIASSRAALQRRQPLFTSRRPAAAEYTSRWPRLALPLVDDEGVARRLLAVTVAVGHDGKTIE